MNGIINTRWPYSITTPGSEVEILHDLGSRYQVRLLRPAKKENLHYVGSNFDIHKTNIDLVYETYIPFFEAL